MDRRMALTANPGRGVRAAQGHALIDGDVVADLGGLADDAEAVVEEEAPPDLGAGVDVDRSQEPCEMVDQAGDEIKPPLPQPVGYPMQGKRPDAGIKQHV